MEEAHYQGQAGRIGVMQGTEAYLDPESFTDLHSLLEQCSIHPADVQLRDGNFVAPLVPNEIAVEEEVTDTNLDDWWDRHLANRDHREADCQQETGQKGDSEDDVIPEKIPPPAKKKKAGRRKRGVNLGGAAGPPPKKKKVTNKAEFMTAKSLCDTKKKVKLLSDQYERTKKSKSFIMMQSMAENARACVTQNPHLYYDPAIRAICLDHLEKYYTEMYGQNIFEDIRPLLDNVKKEYG